MRLQCDYSAITGDYSAITGDYSAITDDYSAITNDYKRLQVFTCVLALLEERLQMNIILFVEMVQSTCVEGW